MRKRVLVVAALCVVAVGLSAARAGAIPIHHHYTVMRPTLIPRPNDSLGKSLVMRRVTKVERYDVAPPYRPPSPPAPVESYTPEATSTTSYSTSTTTASTTTSGTGVPACDWSAESGSAGYSAYNPSSGATGRYQILPSTAANYGCDLSTPAGQDACASAIYADVGASAWSSSGACG